MSLTYSSIKTKPLTKKDLVRAIEYLEKNSETDEPTIIKISFKKIPDEIEKLKYAESFGMGAIYGTPLFEDKKIPERECHLEKSDGQIIIIKI